MKKYVTILKQFLRFKKPDNLKVVAYCILTAATFWFFSALNKEYDASVKYPVEWVFDEERFIVVEEMPENIQINVSGLGWNLLRANSGFGLQPLSLKLTDPATNHSLPGNYFANQVAEALDELQLNYIIEDSLLFNIDYRITQSFPIYIDSLSIDLDEGYRIISPINFDTELVEIEGPRKILAEMPKDTFWVQVIETNIDGYFDNEVPIQVENPDLMKVKPQTVNVVFDVAKFINQEVELPIQYTNTENLKNIFVKDSLITVRYLIQEDFKDSLFRDSLIVIADFNSINKADSTLALLLQSKGKYVIDPYFNFPQVKVYYNE
ncbi:hypothetical protein MNBD_BACTEROID06-193 [hydrothermal vent metagenome]|uniref:YbbR-like domain-containing protein n=1 Tax=hydrothermal vent metagenome TaxID=652676 RepID=A0A3B0USW5_9ZZZZ